MKKTLTLILILAAVGGVVLALAPRVRAKSMRELLPLPRVIQDAQGNAVKTETLRGKTVALYFSAQWCIPCKQFTPKLAQFREDNKNNEFEVVFMSLDRDPVMKTNYMQEEGMQWLTTPDHNSKEIGEIMDYYQLPGIPSVIVFSPDGEMITTNGREDITNDPLNALSKWRSM